MHARAMQYRQAVGREAVSHASDLVMQTLCCVVSCVPCSIGKLLGEKLSVMRLTWYTSPVIAASLFPFYLSLESRELSEYRKTTDVPVGECVCVCVCVCDRE